MSSSADFARLTEPHRRELLALCYRMLGSPDEAEDLVQETYLRAWRGWPEFAGRSSVRTWLYRIATNACLTARGVNRRRPLPAGLGAPADPDDPPLPAFDVDWLAPVPDALVEPVDADPATIVAFRDSVRLALVASLQYLPPRQRAVLILRDVLDFPAAEVAATLGTSTAAVKSMLQRARGRLEELDPAAERLAEPAEPAARALLEQYMTAFERADPDALERVLRKDAALELTKFRNWYSGLDTCLRSIRVGMAGGPGGWRMQPTRANGQPAAAVWLRGPDGVHRANGIAVLTLAGDRIARITVFADPALVTLFGHPEIAP